MPTSRLRVVSRDDVAEDVVRLSLSRPDGSELPAWTPGAHIDVHIGEIVRQYSLCGDPDDRRSYSIAVLRVQESRGGSAGVHDDLIVGSEIVVGTPRNLFGLEPASGYLFVVGGIGITPILPMIGQLSAAGAPWRLAYGGRTRRHMAFAGDLAARYGNAVSLLPQDEQDLIPVRELLGSVAPGELVYACGPEPLLRAVETVADELGITASLRLERFVSTTRPDGLIDEAFEIEIASSGDVLQVPVGRSALDVLLEAGVDIDSSCREGTCGTCETLVLAGRPDHRDSILSPAERAADDVMFVCVSRARDPRLTLDL